MLFYALHVLNVRVKGVEIRTSCFPFFNLKEVAFSDSLEP